LVGDQQDAFLGCRAELQALVSDLRLNDRVEFPGFLPDPQLADLCRRTRLFVAPSLLEGFGLPAVEAMACGAPLIISRGHALDEVAADAALTFDARDVDELRSRIDQALADDALCRRLSAASLRQAATFSWDQTARGVFSALSSVAGNPVTAD
jgi:glycosyltransferase involved in cell wall biosynthesis